MDRLGELHDAGVSIWLDTLSRDLLGSGEFARLVNDQQSARDDAGDIVARRRRHRSRTRR